MFDHLWVRCWPLHAGALLLVLSAPALAGDQVQMPDGGTCFINANGALYGCTAPLTVHNHQPNGPSQQQLRALKQNAYRQGVLDQKSFQSQQDAAYARQMNQAAADATRARAEQKRQQEVQAQLRIDAEVGEMNVQNQHESRVANGLTTSICKVKDAHGQISYSNCPTGAPDSAIVEH